MLGYSGRRLRSYLYYYLKLELVTFFALGLDTAKPYMSSTTLGSIAGSIAGSAVGVIAGSAVGVIVGSAVGSDSGLVATAHSSA